MVVHGRGEAPLEALCQQLEKEGKIDENWLLRLGALPGRTRKSGPKGLNCYNKLLIELQSSYFNYLTRWAYWLGYLSKNSVFWRQVVYKVVGRSELWIK